MKFTVSTKPLATALDLAVVSSNVNQFWKPSCLAQVSVSGRELIVNLEADRIASELRFKGAPEVENESAIVFVDCLLFKQLISTLDSSNIILEFTDSGLIIYSGKSKFTLSKMLDAGEMELTRPRVDSYDYGSEVDVDKSGWKYVKDHQMYSIAMSFAYPVYTRVWVGENGDVLVGDMNSSLFTYSKKSNLGQTCLLKDTIINLFNSLPEGAKISKGDKAYLIRLHTDSFDYVSEFRPQYESDEDMGDYNAGIILAELKHPDYSIKVNPAILTKFISQASLLASGVDATINVSIGHGSIKLHDKNVNCSVDVEGTDGHDIVEILFQTKDIQSVLKTYTDEIIHIGPIFDEDGVAKGLVFWNDTLTTVLGGVE